MLHEPPDRSLRRLQVLVQTWLLLFVVCATLTALSFARLDLPITLHFWTPGRSLSSLNSPFGASVILTLESAVALGLIVTRLVRGHISRIAEVLALACLASICTYGINTEVLKPFFGVPNPGDVVEGARHSFNFLKGAENSSFPSGHMVLASAFAGVFMSLYRRSVWPMSALLLLGAGLLIVGGWHFLSDVIAGAFLGVSTGILAGEVWAAHSTLPPESDRRSS